MNIIHHLNNSKNANYPNQSPLNTQCVRYILRIISALRNAPKELRLKLTGLYRCSHRERLKAAAEYVHPHLRKAYPIHHFQATRTRKQTTSDEKRTTSEDPLYYSREYSTNQPFFAKQTQFQKSQICPKDIYNKNLRQI